MGMAPLTSSDLRQRITIQAPQYAPDGAGGRTLTGWTDVASAFASVEPVNGGEAFRQGIARSTQFYRVRVRFRTDVATTNRLLLNALPLNIRTCGDPTGRRAELLITAESGVADG